MLGIDIYERYQDVRDWAAVARHGVRFCWVKASDGGTTFRTDPARRPDALVAGAKSVGIAVGLYHFAQPSPAPETQADILTGEVRRLGATGLPPALDLEAPFTPGPAARDFAIRFLRRLIANDQRAAIYGNTSMFAGIRPDTWDFPGLVIWAADYGANTGHRDPDLRPYPGRADAHQYTSVGVVAGIGGRVDLNESLTDFITGGGDPDMTPDEHTMLARIAGQLDKIGRQTALPPLNRHTDAADTIVDSRVLIDRILVRLDGLTGALDDTEAAIITAVREIVAADQDTEINVGPEHIDAIVGGVVAGLPDSVTQQQVEESVRRVFADAATPAT